MELDNILKGDASITMLCIVYSLQLQYKPDPYTEAAGPSAVHLMEATSQGGDPVNGEWQPIGPRVSGCGNSPQQRTSAHPGPS